jgi:hypothetical protein
VNLKLNNTKSLARLTLGFCFSKEHSQKFLNSRLCGRF